jgi:hypothetical protein
MSVGSVSGIEPGFGPGGASGADPSQAINKEQIDTSIALRRVSRNPRDRVLPASDVSTSDILRIVLLEMVI